MKKPKHVSVTLQCRVSGDILPKHVSEHILESVNYDLVEHSKAVNNRQWQQQYRTSEAYSIGRGGWRAEHRDLMCGNNSWSIKA